MSAGDSGLKLSVPIDVIKAQIRNAELHLSANIDELLKTIAKQSGTNSLPGQSSPRAQMKQVRNSRQKGTKSRRSAAIDENLTVPIPQSEKLLANLAEKLLQRDLKNS